MNAYLIQNLEQRKEEIIRLIDKQEKLTPELEAKITGCTVLKEIEDIYLPFKPKKRTRATIAKEKGLQPLADIIIGQEISEEQILLKAAEFFDEEKQVTSVKDAIEGACDIIAEQISENADYRKTIRNLTHQFDLISSAVVKVKDQETQRNEFEAYYDYREPIRSIADHRVLALNRGETKKILKIETEAPIDKIIAYLNLHILKKSASSFLSRTVEDAYKRLIAPAIERETRTALSQKADESAILVFAKNLKSLLLCLPAKKEK